MKHGTWNYTYDANGNLQTDPSKGITTNMVYNLLNLPQSIPDKSTTYTYDASGQKLRRVIGSTATDYIGGIEYDNSTSSIAFIQTEEGRAVPNGATAYNYQYILTDHLGNSRVSFETKTGAAVQVQQDDYYPFGMEILRTSPVPTLKNEYLYNKKELQENLGLYDYGARFYDPIIGRWNTIDPLAELNRRFSTYNYVKDNPIINIDPDGMDDVQTNGTGSSTGEASASANADGDSDGDSDPNKITDKGIIRQLFNKYVKPVVEKYFRDNAAAAAQLDAWQKKRVMNAPHLKPLEHWWEKLGENRIFNGIEYDDDGNPIRIAPTILEFPLWTDGPGELQFVTSNVAGYFLKSAAYLEGSTYIKTISILGNGLKEGKGLVALTKALEAEAKVAGATEIVIKGTSVLNGKLFNAKTAERLGYIYTKIDEAAFELRKSIK